MSTMSEPLTDDVLRTRALERLRVLLRQEPELGQAVPSPEAIEALDRCSTTIETVAKAFEIYADRPCLGERAFEIGADGTARLLPRFRTRRFSEIWARVEAFASGLAHEGLAATGEFVGICGFGTIDWVVADLACLRLAAVSVPLQTGMPAAELRQIIRETELVCIVCSVEQLDSIEAVLPECPSVRSIVVMDVRPGERAAETRLAASMTGPVPVHAMTEVEQRGHDLGIVPQVLPSARGEADPLMTLVYTSGSTGTPKGAMIPESLLRRQWGPGFFRAAQCLIPDLPQATVNYMPLNRLAGRGTISGSLRRGGITYFTAKSDMSTLLEDLRLARPTSMLLVPRVSATIYQAYQRELVRRTAGTINARQRERIARNLLEETRESVFGDRFLLATTGSAPTPPAIAEFLKRCFEVPVLDGYGSTEAGPVTLQNRVDNEEVVAYRLVDVPELGYRTSDRPYPRGELHVKTRWMVPGYYKNERATQELFDDAGFLNTGDIVEQRGPDELVWIDRAKNVLKLSQGEFVATSRLEELYASRSPFVRQIFLYGTSFRGYLLAVLVPDIEAASAHLHAQGIELVEPALENLLRSEIQRVAREEQLRGFEVPRDFLVERQPFSRENGLLTASNKPSRGRLAARYGSRLEGMYEAIERAQLEALGNLGAETPSIADRLKKAVRVTLGLADLDPRQTDQSFLQLGGDSLSAVGLESLIHELTGVHVPVGLLLDPTSTVGALVDHVESAASGEGRRRVSFAEVHGTGAKTVRADDIRIEKFLGPDEIRAAGAARPASELPARAEVALLTGANGFLGRFLTLELLERLSGTRKLYALVRAPTDAAALSRLASSYRTDPALTKRFEELSAEGRLTVLAGDLMKPRLGLPDRVYARLEEELDLVVHAGALVNHALDYEQVFEPNVLGTVEVLRLALARRIKSVSYVSTIGALSGVERDEPVREDEDLRSLLTERPTDVGYAPGYSTSKWVSELLFRDAHDKLGLPVAVFRPSEMMAHSAYRGQVNMPDFFTRLLAGLVYTRLAPRSFYAAGATARAEHFDGLPVDAVSRSIAAPSTDRPAPGPRYDTCHVVNPHCDDGITLDTVIAWVETAGYPLERVADYDDWYRSFRARLTSLGEPARRNSPLAILSAWAKPQGAPGQLEPDSARLLERLRSISPSLAQLPHVSEGLIHKALDDMAALGVVERPLRPTG